MGTLSPAGGQESSSSWGLRTETVQPKEESTENWSPVQSKEEPTKNWLSINPQEPGENCSPVQPKEEPIENWSPTNPQEPGENWSPVQPKEEPIENWSSTNLQEPIRPKPSHLLSHLLSGTFDAPPAPPAHGGYPPMMCGRCGRMFTRGSAFSNHQKACLTSGRQRTQHANTAICTMCGHQFANATALANHQRTCGLERQTAVPHEATFACCHCGWASKRASSFTYHMKTCALANSAAGGDGSSGDDAMQCDICKRRFEDLMGLMEHRRNLSCMQE
ncbi:PREDICTED: zinc finger protein 449-like [Priapulus caudatus]|uniref:Zinc finger protein 449-like n=1 Tax=Priapulus caudatus TaxID=37621 RepID=A0ABM1EJE2_PRICU|nr:PREDICTED: zinc finger protein 449-like [Priapulus caudatus]